MTAAMGDAVARAEILTLAAFTALIDCMVLSTGAGAAENDTEPIGNTTPIWGKETAPGAMAGAPTALEPVRVVIVPTRLCADALMENASSATPMNLFTSLEYILIHPYT